MNLDSDALPLDFAALQGCVEAVSLLLRSGADPNKRCAKVKQQKDGLTAMDIAAANGHDSVMVLLIRGGCDVNAASPMGWTSLHWAAERAQANAVKRLLEHKADPDGQDIDGLTAVDWTRDSLHGFAGRKGKGVQDCQDERVSCLVELVKAGAVIGIPMGLRPDVVVEQVRRTAPRVSHPCRRRMS